MNNRNWLRPTSKRYLSVGVTAANWRNITTSLMPLAPETEWLHLDVMDGQFSPKLTVGAWAIGALPQGFIVDAHVMTQSPINQALTLAKHGAHAVTLQYESLASPVNNLIELEQVKVTYQGKTLPLIRGISLCPETNLNVLGNLLPHVEIIQLLTLDPRTGEKIDKKEFISRLNKLKVLLNDSEYAPIISVDGSMSLDIAKASVAEGAHIVVSGSALFKDNALSDNLLHWRNHLYD
ncbi:hypothetical protein ACQKPX_17455 [Photobacterium sp. DNB23_23_1]